MFRASRVSASGLELPPSTDRPQSFTTQLGSAVYQFDLRWNDRSNVWTMDISDPVSGNPIVSGLAVVLGADLLKPYALGIGTLILVDETSTNTEAALDSLGSSVNLYWVSRGCFVGRLSRKHSGRLK